MHNCLLALFEDLGDPLAGNADRRGELAQGDALGAGGVQRLPLGAPRFLELAFGSLEAFVCFAHPNADSKTCVVTPGYPESA
jgi:hypothetical protein